MLNKVHLIGYLGSDPELRYTQEGEAVTRARLATSETWKKDGKRVEKTEWHNIVFFGKLAETAGEFLKKGSLVYLEGKLHTRQWEKDGENRYTTEIIADGLKILPFRPKAETESQKDAGAACGPF